MFYRGPGAGRGGGEDGSPLLRDGVQLHRAQEFVILKGVVPNAQQQANNARQRAGSSTEGPSGSSDNDTSPNSNHDKLPARRKKDLSSAPASLKTPPAAVSSHAACTIAPSYAPGCVSSAVDNCNGASSIVLQAPQQLARDQHSITAPTFNGMVPPVAPPQHAALERPQPLHAQMVAPPSYQLGGVIAGPCAPGFMPSAFSMAVPFQGATMLQWPQSFVTTPLQSTASSQQTTSHDAAVVHASTIACAARNASQAAIVTAPMLSAATSKRRAPEGSTTDAPEHCEKLSRLTEPK